jgi:HAD superfamily hydrolase (TIGR01549 family)
VDERLPLDAVIFDAGGTLVRLDFEWIAEMLAELGAPVTVEALRHSEIHGRRLYDASAMGTLDLPPGTPHPPLGPAAPVEAYWGGMLQGAGVPRDLIEEGLARMDARQKSDHFLWAKPMEGARGALDAMPALGLRIACVSNSDGRAEEHLVRYGVREGLEFVIDSAIVGIEKPDPRIFDLALDKLGVDPNRALYVGDIRSVDEHGSRSAGMQFVLLDPYGSYAHRDTASIPTIADLPQYLTETFLVPAAEERRSR